MPGSLATYSMTTDDVFESAERGLLYAVLDAAGAPDVPPKMDEPDVEAQALYEVNVNPDLRLAAPYLVRLNADVMAWIHEHLWQDHWGILVEADIGLMDLREHLQPFLLTTTPTHRTMYFRFYDPRVLKTFLPSCDERRLAEFFGPVQGFIARGDGPDEFVRYAFEPAGPAASGHGRSLR